jgi:hypothetical protein
VAPRYRLCPHCESVAITTGREVLAGIPPSAIGACKIDVEGYEYEVFRGMREFIATHRGIQYCVEITDPWIRECSGQHTGAKALIDEFRSLGFSAFTLHRSGQLEPLLEAPEKQTDVVFRCVH